MEISPLAPAAGKVPRLASGMLLQVRFTLRRQRPVALLLEPLRRWLD